MHEIFFNVKFCACAKIDVEFFFARFPVCMCNNKQLRAIVSVQQLGNTACIFAWLIRLWHHVCIRTKLYTEPGDVTNLETDYDSDAVTQMGNPYLLDIIDTVLVEKCVTLFLKTHALSMR